MAETQPSATPPATSGGLTKEDVQAIIADALKPLAENQKILADTLAKLPPAAKEPEKKDGEVKPLTAEDVARIVAEQVKTARETDAQAAAKQAARQKVIDAKLKGVPAEFLASLPDSADEKELTAAADKIVARVGELKIALPDVGGASKDGGTTASQPATPANKAPFLTEGEAKFAAGIKLPA